MMEAGGAGGGGYRDERVPQWGAQETRELIAARGEMEREAAAAAARRSARTLWEAVAARLRERGYRRTAEQCKCKWKNLVNSYKGKETSDPENGRQCPFFEELHAVFTERARNMQRQLLQSESGASVKRKLKRHSGDRSTEEPDDEEDDAEASDDVKPMRSRKRKAGDKGQQSQRMAEKSSIHDLLQDFLVQQQHMDIQWREMKERRAQERLVFEQEWRQSMQKLEQERLMLEHSWMEREEQRRMREEARAEKRDSLLTTLLNKLLQEDL